MSCKCKITRNRGGWIDPDCRRHGATSGRVETLHSWVNGTSTFRLVRLWNYSTERLFDKPCIQYRPIDTEESWVIDLRPSTSFNEIARLAAELKAVEEWAAGKGKGTA